MTESIIKAHLVKLLNKSGLLWWRNQSGTAKGGKMRLAVRGTPDLSVGLHGVTYYIECKAPGETLSKDQVVWRDRYNPRPGTYVVVDSLASCDTIVYLLTGAMYRPNDLPYMTMESIDYLLYASNK